MSPAEISTSMFKHFDFDHNDCLTYTDMNHEFHLMDQNGEYTALPHVEDSLKYS
ncbi:hypothetical protein DPMN_133073 [Dreissena polymorpha]|uniref:EF-hand domain-containing protein n=1 Tax=Dreissena polymorpha TaxID=45954 RepID=A0A9D4JAM7_DREPO|nr:hypothetical protein DPMN_133073 [Dreissena polymorpha]